MDHYVLFSFLRARAQWAGAFVEVASRQNQVLRIVMYQLGGMPLPYLKMHLGREHPCGWSANAAVVRVVRVLAQLSAVLREVRL